MYGALAIVLSVLFQAIGSPLTLAGHGLQALGGKPAPAKFELRLAEEIPADGLIEATVEHTGKKIYLAKQTIVDDRDLIEASAVEEQGLFRIDVRFNEDGARRMARASEAHLGKPIAILIDGRVVSAPIVRSLVSDRAAISGGFTKEEAAKLASRIMGR